MAMILLVWLSVRVYVDDLFIARGRFPALSIAGVFIF